MEFIEHYKRNAILGVIIKKRFYLSNIGLGVSKLEGDINSN